MIRLTFLAVLEWLALSWSWSTLVREGAAMRRAASAGVVVGPGDAVVLGVQVAAVVAAAWLLLGTVHDTVLVLRSGGSAADRGVTPRWVRRIIEQAIGTTLLLSVMAGSSPVAMAAGAEAVPAQPPAAPIPGADPTEGPEGTIDGTIDGAVDGDDVDDVVASPAPAEGRGASGVEDPPAEGPARTHTVARGENLWVIARGQLIGAGLAAPTDQQVHAYWVRLIAANLPTLRSGVPDLIHPGEALALPGHDDTPPAERSVEGGGPR